MLRKGWFRGIRPSTLLRFSAHYPALAALPFDLGETRPALLRQLTEIAAAAEMERLPTDENSPTCQWRWLTKDGNGLESRGFM
ncbi:hypothetical protein [Roseomonas harenae]|uniref:hypothetical protein n=1 Tax=Muricoccus harenae TaxID=2692566 RepID=UPI001F3F916E|nr:hypothetical protein [Roseomonas harenae]